MAAAKEVKAKYRGRIEKSGWAEVENQALPIELHHMILWVMLNQDDAAYLLPAYEKLRQQATERNEGSAKNHGVEV